MTKKSKQCLKKNFRKPGELLLKTTLKNYNKVLLLESDMYTNGETFY